MRRTAIYILTLLMAGIVLFSCSNDIATTGEGDALARVAFSTEGSSARAIEASKVEFPDVDGLYWFYQAEKIDGGYATGATTDWTEMNGGSTGIGSRVFQFSAGAWRFSFAGYSDSAGNEQVYESITCDATLSKDTLNTVKIALSYTPSTNGTGTIEIKGIEGLSSASGGYEVKATLRKSGSSDTTEIALANDGSGKYSGTSDVESGTYLLTLTASMNGEELGSVSAIVDVLSGRSTSITGDVKDIGGFEMETDSSGNAVFTISDPSSVDKVIKAAQIYSKATGSESTIRLESDIDSTAGISITEGSVKIDLNGHEMGTGTITVGNAKLAVTDTSSGKEGKISGKVVIDDGGSLDMDSGKIEGSETPTVSIAEGGSANIAGGSIGNTSEGGTAIETSGTVAISGDADISSKGTAISIKGGTATISGGNVESEGGSAVVVDGDNAKAVITGGEVKSTGTTISPGENQIAVDIRNGSADISGGTLSSESGIGVYAEQGTTANISGGTISGNGGKGIGVKVDTGADASITGGSISGEQAGVETSGATTISGSSTSISTETGTAIVVSGGNTAISEGNVSSSGSSTIEINDGELEISGGTVVNNGTDDNATAIDSNGGATAITGGTITSERFSIDNSDHSDSSAVTIGTGATISGKSDYMVTYDAGGATGGTVAEQVKYKGIPVKVSANGFTYDERHDFDGWSGSDGNEYSAGEAYTDNASLALTAKWADLYSITIDKEDCITISPASYENKRAGATITMDSIEISKTGYHYVLSVAEDESGNPIALDGDGRSFTMPAADVTILAKSEANRWTVAIVGNGDTEFITAVSSVAYGTSFNITEAIANDGNSDNLKKYGYSLNGYSAVYGDDKTSVTVLEDNGVYYMTMPDGDVTITTKWLGNEHTVTFVANDDDSDYKAAGMPSDMSGKRTGDTIDVSSYTPTRDYYYFKGWTLNDTTEDVTFSDNKLTMPDEDITFTAQWERMTFTVTTIKEDGIDPSVGGSFETKTVTWGDSVDVGYTDNRTTVDKSTQPVGMYAIYKDSAGYHYPEITKDASDGTKGTFVMPHYNVTVYYKTAAKIGGIVFYINESVLNADTDENPSHYTFYKVDNDGTLSVVGGGRNVPFNEAIEGESKSLAKITSESTYYTLEGGKSDTSKDWCYVIHENGLATSDYAYWGFPGSITTATGIGAGRTNTATIVKYIENGTTYKVGGSYPVMWDLYMDFVKSDSTTNTTGLYDWYIPSYDELYKYVEFEKGGGTKSDGVTVIVTREAWCSSRSGTTSWCYFTRQMRNYTVNGTNVCSGVYVVRSF